MFQLTDLPDTLFLDILTHLKPREIVVHRRVSRASYAALTRPDLSQALLHVFFPRSLECRTVRCQISSASESQPALGPTTELGTEPDSDWPSIFASVARRYHSLTSGTYHTLTTISVLQDAKCFYPFNPWNRTLRRDKMTFPLQLPDRRWTYSDGIIIYPAPSSPPVFKALDLSSNSETTVPFDWSSKIVRRVRLSHAFLVIEWAEEDGSHPLNDSETAHRHFASAFTVTTTSSPLHPSASSPPIVEFRSEWKIHYLGLPLSPSDRLFSTHNATHYALYAHQPTRSPWGEDTPLERLVVWSLNGASQYRPSLDPSSTHKPTTDAGPEIVLRLTNGDLDRWGIRQRDTPRLMRLVLDTTHEARGGNVVLQEEDHQWAAGPQSSETPPARHFLRSTGVPLTALGPAWVDECGAEGDAERSFCPASSSSSSSPGRATGAPCWRHEEFPYLTVAEVVDEAVGVRVCGRRCFAMETVSASVDGSFSAGGGGGTTTAEAVEDGGDAGRAEVQFPDDMWRAVMSGAALAGDERWVVGEDSAGDVSVVRF
ncbi:hypothetical protein CGCVW01_v005443 [Colletotrichum viniferum]|nr:hypothetical protein CGCVW01_v005443 [Colletotrichum viniferum]